MIQRNWHDQMTSNSTKSGADRSAKETLLKLKIPEGPKTVALIPESFAGSNL
jgi:hypothetical protein